MSASEPMEYLEEESSKGDLIKRATTNQECASKRKVPKEAL
jgi:hypothetical protein